jgi:hypothetical protein
MLSLNGSFTQALLDLTRRGQKAFFKLKEEFEDTKGVTIIRKSKKNRQHNGQMKKDKRVNVGN